MSAYEMTFLLNEEAELPTLKGLLEASSGKLTHEEKWGKHTLAFPIKKETAAEFYIWNIEMAEKDLNEFKKKLNYNEKLLRYLILKSDEQSEK